MSRSQQSGAVYPSTSAHIRRCYPHTMTDKCSPCQLLQKHIAVILRKRKKEKTQCRRGPQNQQRQAGEAMRHSKWEKDTWGSPSPHTERRPTPWRRSREAGGVGECPLVKSRLTLRVAPWTVARQAPPSRGFPRQECWSELPSPSPGDLPNPGIESASLASSALAGSFFTTELLGKPVSWMASESNSKHTIY